MRRSTVDGLYCVKSTPNDESSIEKIFRKSLSGSFASWATFREVVRRAIRTSSSAIFDGRSV